MARKDKLLGEAAVKRMEMQISSSKTLTKQKVKKAGIDSLKKVSDAISRKERWVIKSMIAYTATRDHLDEETVKQILFAHLDVEEVEDVTRHHYVRAINFLVDFDLGKILN